ncbi:hypothetical protein BDD26_2422 [Xenorhabdus cabanillasii]|uniref:Uncharacterized protein n=1 Tax=Xenorhabdus cabanillasii TaxID=351673 RepID=A0A3D9ULW0_9GAMM|nr:hypothetical protein [Xenorhabdus cabanillasii]REF27615.1 hypothetical protein BDD26_2422 [Xenorhabdus cabanillasii]
MEIILIIKKGNISEEMAALDIDSGDAAINLFISKTYLSLSNLKAEQDKAYKKSFDIIRGIS